MRNSLTELFFVSKQWYVCLLWEYINTHETTRKNCDIKCCFLNFIKIGLISMHYAIANIVIWLFFAC